MIRFSAPTPPAGHRHLAARVIDQAFRDVVNPHGSPGDRASAQAFLLGSRWLAYWCEVAELDPGRVTDRARAVVATGCGSPRRRSLPRSG